jgi:branched-chain amino acid transport system permease protein
LSAIADDETAAECFGINIYRTKLYCWVISAFMVGLAGGLYFIYSSFISPTAAFAFHWTQAAITGTIIGGRRTIEGPIIGSFIVVLLRQFFLVMFPGLSMLVYGVLIVIVLLIFPEGIMGFMKRIAVHIKVPKNNTSQSELYLDSSFDKGR